MSTLAIWCRVVRSRDVRSRNLDQPELDKIQTIKELLCVTYGLLSLPSLDVSEIDFMLQSLCIF